MKEVNLCEHENLILNEKQVRRYNKARGACEFWLDDDAELKCLDCGTFMMNCPDVSKITNIPHYPKESCPHTHDVKSIYVGAWICLNCGRRIVKAPSTMLHVKTGEQDEGT